MRILSITNTLHHLNYSSDVYDNLIGLNNEEIVQFMFDDMCFEEIKNIEYLTHLSPTTFELIDLLNLNYLLFVNDIIMDSEIAYIAEIDTIKQIESSYERLISILKYLNFSPYYKCDYIDCTIDDILLKNDRNLVKILDWVLNNTNTEIRFDEYSMYLIFINNRIDVLNWITENNIHFNDKHQCEVICVGGGNPDVLKWYVKKHR